MSGPEERPVAAQGADRPSGICIYCGGDLRDPDVDVLVCPVTESYYPQTGIRGPGSHVVRSAAWEAS
jgi:hypothetical protein